MVENIDSNKQVEKQVWYALRTFNCQEQKVSSFLTDKGYLHFIPMIYTQSTDTNKEKKKVINKPMIVGGIYLLCVLLFILFKILAQVGVLNGLDDALQETLSSCIIQILILLIIPFLLYILLTKQSIKDTAKEFRLKKISAKSILFSVLIGIGVYFLIAYVSGFFSTILSFLGAESVPNNKSINYAQYSIPMFFLTVFISAVLPAICEEFIHRGMLIGILSKYGVVFAIVVSSLAFGFLHMNINQCFYAVLIGLFLGYLCIYTKSIIPCMIIHFMNNFLNVFFDFSYINNWIGGGYYGWENYIGYYLGKEAIYLLGIILFVLALVVVVYFSFKLIKNERLDAEVEKMPQNVIEEYENLKERAKSLPTLNSIYEITKSKLNYFLHYTLIKAKEKSVTRLDFIEQPEGNLKFRWYDNIFIFSSILIAICYCIISFISIVI